MTVEKGFHMGSFETKQCSASSFLIGSISSMQMQVMEENIIIGNDASSSHYTTHRNTKNKKSQTGSFGIQHKMKTSAMMANSFISTVSICGWNLSISTRQSFRFSLHWTLVPMIQPSPVENIMVMEKLFMKGFFIDPSWVHLSIHAQNCLRSLWRFPGVAGAST